MLPHFPDRRNIHRTKKDPDGSSSQAGSMAVLHRKVCPLAIRIVTILNSYFPFVGWTCQPHIATLGGDSNCIIQMFSRSPGTFWIFLSLELGRMLT
jgi:hypothetical protein